MNCKKPIFLVILGILLLGNIDSSNAQVLTNLKNKISKTVTETVDKVSSKKDGQNQTQKLNSQKESQENDHTSSNNKPVKKQDQEIDYSDIYTIKSPYPEFKNIHLQAHKGLPRFGNHNPYYYRNKYGGQGDNKPKSALLTNGYKNYGSLLTMHYLDIYYKDIDRTNFTVIDHSNGDNTEAYHSSVAQRNLLNTAYGLGSESTIKTFFCDVSNANCRPTGTWGGSRDEFEAYEKYTTFVEKHLDKLLKWSNEFFKDGTETGYFVNRHKWATPYDFDAQGYWIPSKNDRYKGHSYRFTGEEAFFSEFLPVTNYGNNHLNRITDINSYYPLILLKMDAEAAEALTTKKPQFVYSATKVKIKFKALNDSQVRSPMVEFTYHLLNPVIEFFEDIQLTKKIGEINLENVVYKSK